MGSSRFYITHGMCYIIMLTYCSYFVNIYIGGLLVYNAISRFDGYADQLAQAFHHNNSRLLRDSRI